MTNVSDTAKKAWKDYIEYQQKTISSFENVQNVVGRVGNFESLMKSAQSGDDPLGIVSSAMDFIGAKDWDPDKFLLEDGSLNIDEIKQYMLAAIDASHATDTLKESMREAVDAACEMADGVESAYTTLQSAIGNISKIGPNIQLTYFMYNSLYLLIPYS